MASELVTTLKEETNDGLRCVGEYNGDEYEIEYLRQDIEAAYENEEIEEVLQDLILQNMNREYLEDLFNAGKFECGMFRFEDALMFHFVDPEFVGAFVTIDTGSEIIIDSFVETCKTHLKQS
jgi:hypothetical protein